VPQSAARAVHVGDLPVDAELLLAADVLAGKGLVELDELEVGKLVPERFIRSRTAGAGLMPMIEGWQPP